MVRIESTAGCPRTPVLLLALEEAGLGHDLRLREDGWFERHLGQPGPVVEIDGERRVGLDAVLDVVRTLPVFAGRGIGVEVDAWFARLAELRPAIADVAAARRRGEAPDPARLAVVARFSADLEAGLVGRDFVGGEAPSAADVAFVFLGGAARVGLPLGPRTRAMLARLQARPAWARVLAAFPGAAALNVPPDQAAAR